jgi:hypothetical protein
MFCFCRIPQGFREKKVNAAVLAAFTPIAIFF